MIITDDVTRWSDEDLNDAIASARERYVDLIKEYDRRKRLLYETKRERSDKSAERKE